MKITTRVTKWMAAAATAAAMTAFPAMSHAGIFVNISIAPPAIPVYEQPVAPGPDYIWTPGFWQWDPEVGDYFWVPGTWVVAPRVGYLWTPGYWAFDGGFYGWHGGYWGPHIGYYGGVNYGCGYFGRGYEGGYWNGPHFFYNTAITHVNTVNVHNTYVHNVTVINNVHTSYVGGSGLQSRPTGGEQAAFHEQHVTATALQQQHVNFARQDRSQFAQQNHGAPPAAALARPATNVASFHQAAIAGRPGGTFNQQPAAQQERLNGGQQQVGGQQQLGRQNQQQVGQQQEQYRLQQRQQSQQQDQYRQQQVLQQRQQAQQQQDQFRQQQVQQQRQQAQQQDQFRSQQQRQQAAPQRVEAQPRLEAQPRPEGHPEPRAEEHRR